MTDAPRLADILEQIDRIERATKGGPETFYSSEVIQDAVVRNLEVIGEAAKNVSAATRHRHPSVPWKEMAKFRDLAIHSYGKVLEEAVWDIVSTDLPGIKRALSKVIPDWSAD